MSSEIGICLWENLKSYAVKHLIDLEQNYKTLSENIQFRHLINKKKSDLPAFTFRLKEARDIFAGYYEIVTSERADDLVVNHTFQILQVFSEIDEKIRNELLQDLGWGSELDEIAGQFESNVKKYIAGVCSRTDKVVAIDSFMHYAHLGEKRYARVFDYLFILPKSAFIKCIWELLEELSIDRFTIWHS